MAANLTRIRSMLGAGLINGGMTKPATLTVYIAGTRTAGALAGGTNPTSTTVACRGAVRDWRRKMLGATVVQATDRVVSLVGASLGSTAPKVGDQITIEGRTGRIVDVTRGAAAALYLCLVR